VRSTLEALSDETRLRIVEELAVRECTAGELASLFEISRPGVSRHLRVLRESGLVTCRVDAQRRVYSLGTGPLEELDDWLGKYRAFWSHRLDALDTEIERGKKQRVDGAKPTRKLPGKQLPGKKSQRKGAAG
jgi:DNA-binding transcriptional ArsR family regulator